MDEGHPRQRVPLDVGPDESVTQKRKCQRVHQSISPARKRPAPVVFDPELGTEWCFDVGSGLAVWPWAERPEVTQLRRTRTPKVKAKSKNIPVYAYAVTIRDHLHLESGLEHDLVRELDRQPDVTWLVAQPCKLRLPAKKRGRRVEHTPDLLSRNDDGTVRLWDVRPTEQQDADFKLKVQLTAEACVGVGWEHVVFSGMSRVRRVNLMWLHAYRRSMPWYAGSLRLLREYMSDDFTVSDVLELDAGGGHVLSAMWHGIWTGQIDCDLDRPLKRTTRIVTHEAEVVTS